MVESGVLSSWETSEITSILCLSASSSALAMALKLAESSPSSLGMQVATRPTTGAGFRCTISENISLRTTGSSTRSLCSRVRDTAASTARRERSSRSLRFCLGSLRGVMLPSERIIAILQEEIKGERVEKASFRFDEAVVGARGDGQLRVREQVEQLDGLFGRNPVAVAGEDQRRVGYRGKVLGRVVQRRQPQRRDLLHVRLPVPGAIDVAVRLAQVINK